jgi:hypothetical protein
MFLVPKGRKCWQVVLQRISSRRGGAAWISLRGGAFTGLGYKKGNDSLVPLKGYTLL